VKSEFGKGFVYNLFLFAKHFERDVAEIDGKKDYGLFFNAASDHLFELKIPKQFKKNEIGKLANWIKSTGLKYRFGYEVTVEQTVEFYDKCEELMILIDKELGLKPIKAEWK